MAVALCLGGAALVLLALARTWVAYEIGAAPPLPGRTLELTGALVVPGARALGLLGLAGVLALPATRTWGRLVVGSLLAAAGAGVAVLVIRALADPMEAVARATPPGRAAAGSLDLGGWPYGALLGAGLLVAAGAIVLLRGRQWSALGARFEPQAQPSVAQPTGQAAVWDALDRGEDPTEERPPRSGN